MRSKIWDIVQIAVLALSLVTLIIGVAFCASTVGVPNDDVGALHNLSANMRALLMFVISGVLFVADVAVLVVRAVVGKKK